MSWVTVIWSIGSGGCLTLALIYFVVWWKNRGARANLAFSVMAIAVAAFAALELALMRAQTPEQFGTVARWIHVPAWLIIASLVAFVRLYLRAGRRWLAWAVVGVRTLSLILNFIFSPNINYWRITPLRRTSFLGESVSIPTGVPNPWMLVAQFSLLLLVIFVIDAAVTVWWRGDRRKALAVGGGIVLFVVMATAQAMAVTWQIIAMPLTASLFFQGLVAVMACELSYDVLHAATLIRRLQASEATLRESELRFRIVADAAPVLIWMSGVDKLCTFFNKPWLDFTGRTMEQEIGNGWAEGVHPDDLQRCLKIYTEAFDARKQFVMQYRLRRHDREYRWISDHGVPRYDADGAFVGYIGSCVDVTDLLKQQKALHQFEERVALAAEAAHLGVWELDVTTNRTWVSDKVRELFQFPAQGEITYGDFEKRVHKEDRPARDHAVQKAIRTQGTYEIEYRILLPDGTVRWIGGRGRCVPTEDGESTRLLGVSMDITERKHADELFRLATEASPSGTLLVDDHGRILLVNANIEELFGYARDELIGKEVEILLPERFARSHAGDRAKFFTSPQARAMGAGRELFARRKDGSEFPVEIGLNPIQTPHGLVVLANVIDISPRLAAEEVTRRSREQVELLGRVSLLGEMTASLAHELNQPLAAIVNNATAAMQYLEQGRLDPKQLQEILTDVVRDGHRAYDIMRNVRGAIKKGSAIRGPLNLNDVVNAVTRMVQPDAAAQFCKVEMFLAPDLPAIEGDPTQIQQVIINLVRNAFEAMHDTPHGRRVVEIATSHYGDGTISVVVRDYGSGILETTRERVFEQFFTTKEEGLGMGLAIVRSIVESHGGSIAAENADGGGARFHFRLPVKEEMPQ
jgi:PAS domain S-box-containing protein